jgi:enoyl-CoA hydratase
VERGPSLTSEGLPTDPSVSPTIVIEKSGQIGWLIFNRPASGNSLNAQMLDELEQAWIELDRDPQVRVIINTGNGDAFCTGLDVVQLAKDKAVLREHSRRTRDAELKMTAWHLGIATPVICAVNGVCAGGGLHFVADADIVIAAADATFVDPHVSVGQAVAYEEITLAKSSPMEPIMRMSLVGRHERMSARRAYQLGILSQVVDPPERLRDAAQELAENVAKNSPSAMAASKRAIWSALEFTGGPMPADPSTPH